MRIIAVDPGKVSGVFGFNTETGAFVTYEDYAYPVVHWVESLIIESPDATYVVAERFTFQAKLTHQYDAVEVIGALRYVCAGAPRPAHFNLQSRSQRTRVSHDDLRQIGWYVPTPGGHVIEAARHAVIALARTRPSDDLLRALAGRIV